MAERRPTPYNALAEPKFWMPGYGYGSRDYGGYGMATTPASIPSHDYPNYFLRGLGGEGLPLGSAPPVVMPPLDMLFPPPKTPAPESAPPLLEDDDANDLASLGPRNALAAYGRRRF